MSSSRNMIQDEFLPNCDDKLKEKNILHYKKLSRNVILVNTNIS